MSQSKKGSKVVAKVVSTRCRKYGCNNHQKLRPEFILQNDFSEDQEVNLDNYWKDLSKSLPTLSKIALIYIWLPVSGIDMERSFSAYKTILNDQRHSLSKETIAMLYFLYF